MGATARLHSQGHANLHSVANFHSVDLQHVKRLDRITNSTQQIDKKAFIYALHRRTSLSPDGRPEKGGETPSRTVPKVLEF